MVLNDWELGFQLYMEMVDELQCKLTFFYRTMWFDLIRGREHGCVYIYIYYYLRGFPYLNSYFCMSKIESTLKFTCLEILKNRVRHVKLLILKLLNFR